MCGQRYLSSRPRKRWQPSWKLLPTTLHVFISLPLKPPPPQTLAILPQQCLPPPLLSLSDTQTSVRYALWGWNSRRDGAQWWRQREFFFFCLATCSVSDSDSEGTAEEMIASWDSVWSTERMAANVQAQPQHAHVCVLFNQRVSEAEQSSGLNQGRLCWSDQL